MRNAMLAALVLLTWGCGEDQGPVPPGRPSYCNPLSEEGWCLPPWPSSSLLSKDAGTVTGYRVGYHREGLPRNDKDVAIDPSRYNLLDGFPIGSQIVVAFRDRVSAEGLPGSEKLSSSLESACPVWVLDMKSGERVPLFAEVDLNATSDQTAGLIIRPQVPLRFNTRYAVALRTSLRSVSGGSLQPPEGFRRLRDGLPLDPALQADAPRLEEVIAFLSSRGLRRDELVLAWDFHTASEEAVTGPLLGIVDAGLASLPAGGPAFQVTRSVDHPASKEPHLLREVEGTYEVPSYLASESPDSWLKLDARGKPERTGTQRFPFLAVIPRCAEKATAPLPVLIFGHGLFGDTSETVSDFNKQLNDRLCMLVVSTNFIGLCSADALAVATQVLLDFSGLPRITDRLQQAHLNTQALARLVKGGLLAAPELQLAGKAVADASQLYYLGISNGAIQGVAVAALSHELDRMVLNVPGGWWSLMIQRSSKFKLLAMLLEKVYASPLDRLLVISLSQHLWESSDPISYAARAIRSPWPGRPAKRLLLQEARNDDQVPNLATRALVRGMGLDALAPMVEPVFGISEKPGPLDSAYAQFDLKVPPLPLGNLLPEAREGDLSSHNSLRKQESCLKQTQAFLKVDGKAVSTCQGPCDPE